MFLNLLIPGYFGAMLKLRPEDLIHRILIPLIPLVFFGAGRLAAVAEGLYMPRVSQTLFGTTLLAARSLAHPFPNDRFWTAQSPDRRSLTHRFPIFRSEPVLGPPVSTLFLRVGRMAGLKTGS